MPAVNNLKKDEPFKQYAGLVVIGVSPENRGSGVAQKLMAEFENKSRNLHQTELVLSVKKDNSRAIKAYNNYGWTIREEHDKTFVLHKLIDL